MALILKKLDEVLELNNMKFVNMRNIIHWIVRLIIIGGLGCLLAWTNQAYAQEKEPTYPIYVVQEGDNFWSIAQRFNVTVDEIAAANGISDPNQLQVGMELKIPGISGIEGKLITEKVPFGEDLKSLSRKYQFPIPTLAKLNRLVSPASLYVGKNLVLTEQLGKREEDENFSKTWLKSNQSILELAVLSGENPWKILKVNGFDSSCQVLPHDTLFIKGDGSESAGSLPPQIQAADVQSLPLGQGKTATIRIMLDSEGLGTQAPEKIGGEFINHEFLFYKESSSPNGESWVALLGIHNQVEPGFYPMVVTFTYPDGETFNYSQLVYVKDSGFLFEKLTVKDKSLLDPANTEPEEKEILNYTTHYTDEKLWNGKFQSPVAAEYTECWPSTFGRRRSYNGSAFTYIHSGLDFCGQVGHKIFAPAEGKVVYTGSFFVRGNTTIIDHGWGVFTLYAHQSEIDVKVGDIVEKGQVIGLVGNSGRVTGPHLHWEVWVGGVQVDPYDWILNEYPTPYKAEGTP